VLSAASAAAAVSQIRTFPVLPVLLLNVRGLLGLLLGAGVVLEHAHKGLAYKGRDGGGRGGTAGGGERVTLREECFLFLLNIDPIFTYSIQNQSKNIMLRYECVRHIP
jgi:hypothetical protein